MARSRVDGSRFSAAGQPRRRHRHAFLGRQLLRLEQPRFGQRPVGIGLAPLPDLGEGRRPADDVVACRAAKCR